MHLFSSSFQIKVPGASLHADLVTNKAQTKGTHPIVLLHGGPGADSRYLRPQCDKLATFSIKNQLIDLVYYDQRGAERSPLEPGQVPLGYQTHVEDVEQVRLFLGIKKTTLFGYSWGGLLALLYALRYPQQVERLILIAPAPIWTVWREQMKKNLIEAAHRPIVEELKKAWLSHEEQFSPEQKRHYRFALAVNGYFCNPSRALELTPFRVIQKVEEAIWSSLGHWDLRPQLGTLKGMNTLIVQGKQDVIPLENAEEIAQKLDAQLAVLDDCGHVPYIEGQDGLWSAIQNFLS